MLAVYIAIPSVLIAMLVVLSLGMLYYRASNILSLLGRMRLLFLLHNNAVSASMTENIRFDLLDIRWKNALTVLMLGMGMYLL